MRSRYQPAWVLILFVPFIVGCGVISTQAPENQPVPTTTHSSRPTQAATKAPEPSATQTMPQPTSPPKKDKPSEPSEIAPEKIIYLQFDHEIITSGVAEEILFSPDGSKIAAFRDIGAQMGKTIVSIFEYPSGELLVEQELAIKTIKGDEDRVAIFSPDSNYLIYSNIKWNEEDPTGISTITVISSMSLIDGSIQEVRSFEAYFLGDAIIDYAPSGELLAIPHDVPPLQSMLEESVGIYKTVFDYAWSEDGSQLVIYFIDGRLYYWDVEDENNSRWLVEESLSVPYMLEDIAFQPAHNRWVGIAVVNNQSREIIDLVSGELLGVLPLYEYTEYLELAFIMDGEVISVENGLFFFNSAGKRIGSAMLDYDERQSIAISPDRQTVAIGGLKSIQFFKVKSLDDLR